MPEDENNKAVVKKEENQAVDKEIPIPPEILDKIPTEAREEIEKFISIAATSRYVGPMPHPLTSKITEEHVTKIIDNVEKDDQRSFEERKGVRNTTLTIFILILVFIAGFLIFFTLRGQTEILIPLLTAVVGAGGGYGIGRSTK